MNLTPERLILFVPAFVIAIAVHEGSHAFIGTLLGDTTPRKQGRLTLNPLKHLDPLGTILLITQGFGWGKPVYVDPSQFRINPISGNALVAVAGPISNLLTAVVSAIVFNEAFDPGVRLTALRGTVIMSDPVSLAAGVALELMIISVTLAIFNLIPLPPLDGFSVLMGVLPRPLAYAIAPLYKYGPPALLLLFFLPALLHVDVIGPVIRPPISWIITHLIVR